MPTSEYYRELRERYLNKGKEAVLGQLRQCSRAAYDDAWATALRFRMVWESDLKSWIREWKEQGLLAIDGLGPREKVPKRKSNHTLVWKAAG